METRSRERFDIVPGAMPAQTTGSYASSDPTALAIVFAASRFIPALGTRIVYGHDRPARLLSSAIGLIRFHSSVGSSVLHDRLAHHRLSDQGLSAQDAPISFTTELPRLGLQGEVPVDDPALGLGVVPFSPCLFDSGQGQRGGVLVGRTLRSTPNPGIRFACWSLRLTTGALDSGDG
jgi:hypothetical protein